VLLICAGALGAITPSQADVLTEFVIQPSAPGYRVGDFFAGTERLDSIAGLSAGSLDRRFVAQTFTPLASGTYTFGQSFSSRDSILILYQGSYDPANPSRNAIALNDDSDGLGAGGVRMGVCGGSTARELCPKLSLSLTAGTDYVVVISTYHSRYGQPPHGYDVKVDPPVGFYVFGPAAVGVGGVFPNKAPTATASLTGTAQENQTLTGSYQYSDADSDAENRTASGTSYRFVRSTDHSVSTTGDNSVVASGATGGTTRTYVLQAADVNQYLFYCVTPAAAAGVSPGAEACSPATQQVHAAPITGICGSSGPLTSPPTGARCTAGLPTAVSSTDTLYTWSCNGVFGGGDTACSADRYYQVSPGVSIPNGIISPDTVQAVPYNATPTFTATPNAAFKVDSFIGTCLGTRSGASFTLAPVTADCNVKAVFVPNDPPIATVSLTGTGAAGDLMEGTYTYSDTENDPQDTSGSGTAYRFVASIDSDITTPIDNQDVQSGFTRGATQPYVPRDPTDVGKYLFYCVTPVAATGGLTGVEVCSPVSHQVFIAPINGDCGSSNKLTFTNTPVSKLCKAGIPRRVVESTTYYTWICSELKGGTPASCGAARQYDVRPSAGANGAISPNSLQRIDYQTTLSFTATADAAYKLDDFTGTCPGARSGNTFTLDPVRTNCTVQALFIPNDPPTATVSLAGSGATGAAMTGSYSYRDTENDPEDTAATAYRFVVSDDHEILTTGDNTEVASGLTNGADQTFTPSAAEIGKYLFYCVAPVAQTGGLTGPEVCSPVSHQVYQTPIPGACGASDQLVITHTPVSKLCANGVPSSVTEGTDTYDWTCAGVGGAADASCSATREYDVVTSANPQGQGSISPSPIERVVYQATPAFSITPAAGFIIAAVTGTCGGQLNGGSYQVDPVTRNCSVEATFASDQPPTLTATTARGPTPGGTTLTLTGTGFVPGVTTVTIGGQACNSVIVSSPTQLTCVTPAGLAGAQPLVVTTPSGVASGVFTYDDAPTLAAILPNQGPLTGGTTLTLSGTGFIPGATTVTVGGRPCDFVIVSSPTQLTCVTPAGLAGAQPVVVATSGGASNAGVFTYASTTPPTDIPTLSQWGLLLLGALLALITRWRGPMQAAGRR
jgi:hypothetical protein